MQIVDTHQHLWDLSRHRHSWCAGIPTLNRSFVMSDYLAGAAEAADTASVVASVHVEADVDEPDMEAETRWLLSLVRDADNPLQGLVVKVLPERGDVLAYLDRYPDDPDDGEHFRQAIKGVRRVLHTEPDDLSRSEGFREQVRALASRGLTFDLCVLAKQLPIGLELVRACPDVQFILDHCGVPDIKGGALDPWRADLRELAREPNVIACKISGLVAYADPKTWTTDDLRPYVEHTVDCFGPERIVFGSDWPVCTLSATLARWLAAADELTSGWSSEQREAFFARNARRVYRIDA